MCSWFYIYVYINILYIYLSQKSAFLSFLLVFVLLCGDCGSSGYIMSTLVCDFTDVVLLCIQSAASAFWPDVALFKDEIIPLLVKKNW